MLDTAKFAQDTKVNLIGAPAISFICKVLFLANMLIFFFDSQPRKIKILKLLIFKTNIVFALQLSDGAIIWFSFNLHLKKENKNET